MPSIGNDARPTTASEYWIGGINNQVAEELTMPEDGTITRLGCWIRGVSGNGSVSFRLAIWQKGGSDSSGNTLLGESALQTVSAAAVDTGNLTQFEVNLTTPVVLANGEDFYVGFCRAPAGAHQIGLRGSGDHRDKYVSGGWPGSFNNPDHTGHNGTIGAWVANYDAATVGVLVRRSGAWVDGLAGAGGAFVRRGGIWVNTATGDPIRIRRGGAWVDVT